MNYGLIYTVPFATIDNGPCVVEIEKDGYSGEVTELIAGPSPFTVDIDNEEFLYTPTRFSTATIRIVGSDYLQSLFSTSYQMFRVTFKIGGIVKWCGFVKPELYTQDYTSDTFELELECISAMSSLEFIDYKQSGESKIFISIWDLLKNCILSARGQYDAIYIPHVYGADEIEYNSNNNILEEMTISEQNFFDEDDKPMKLKEVLEEVCKFLNWTCVDWRGELYFMDVDHIGEYRRHDPLIFDWDGDTVAPELNNIQNIGFAGSDHSLDILPGYNKVTIKDSNYCFDNAIPEEDFEKLKSFTEKKTYSYDKYYEVRQYLKSEIYEFPHYFNSSAQTSYNDIGLVNENDTNVYVEEPANLFLGGYCAKRCLYELNDGKPNITDWQWEYVYELKITSEHTYSFPSTVPPTGDEQETPDWKPPTIVKQKEIPRGNVLMRYRNKQPIKYYDGAFGLSMAIQRCFDADMTSCRARYWGDGVMDFILLCRLRIGNYYYNGSGWIESIDKPTDIQLTFEIKINNANLRGWTYNDNNKALDMPYDGLKGYIIEIPNNINLFGDLEFELIHYHWFPDFSYGINLKDIKIDFKKKNVDEDDNSEESNSDRIYENVVNENYINELDEIELKISSYNNDGTCYSKILMGANYLTDNLYSIIEGITIRPEEQLIRRIIKRYSAPRIKLTQVIKETSDLTPICRLYDNYMVNKKFIIAGGTIDYAMNQFQCIMIEV